MNQLQLFLPCAAGVEALLATEVKRITGYAKRSESGAGAFTAEAQRTQRAAERF